MVNNKIGFDIPHSAIGEITSMSSALQEILDVPIYKEMQEHAIWLEGIAQGYNFKSITDIAGWNALIDITLSIDTDALYNVASSFNYNNDTLLSMFKSTSIDEFESILNTDNGIDTLQSLYDSVIADLPYTDDSMESKDTVQEDNHVDVRSLSMNDKIQLWCVILDMIMTILFSVTDDTGKHVEELIQNSNQQIKLEQQQLDEQVKHNEEQVRHNKKIESLEEDKIDALNRIGDALERANDLKEKSVTD